MIRTVLIDLSGTLHIGDEAIPGGVAALKRLLPTSLTVKFVTNTTKECKRILHNRLTALGYTVKPEDILSSLGAARELIIRRQLKPMLLLEAEAMEDFQELTCPANQIPNAVVIGLAPSQFNYTKLNEAFGYLNAGAELIGIHAGKYYKTCNGLELGPGCFVKGLEYAAQCQAELVGKPNKSFFLCALGDCPPNEAVMIGDDVTDDVQGAMQAGLQGYLVKTGKYRQGDENKIQPPPTEVFPSIVEAIEKILGEIKQ